MTLVCVRKIEKRESPSTLGRRLPCNEIQMKLLARTHMRPCCYHPLIPVWVIQNMHAISNACLHFLFVFNQILWSHFFEIQMDQASNFETKFKLCDRNFVIQFCRDPKLLKYSTTQVVSPSDLIDPIRRFEFKKSVWIRNKRGFEISAIVTKLNFQEFAKIV